MGISGFPGISWELNIPGIRDIPGIKYTGELNILGIK
jgi:hypothetical protein